MSVVRSCELSHYRTPPHLRGGTRGARGCDIVQRIRLLRPTFCAYTRKEARRLTAAAAEEQVQSLHLQLGHGDHWSCSV